MSRVCHKLPWAGPGGRDVITHGTFEDHPDCLPETPVKDALQDHRAQPCHLLAVGVPWTTRVALCEPPSGLPLVVSRVC